MRKLLLVGAACIWLGASGRVQSLNDIPDAGRVRDLLVGIFEDVSSIGNSFSGGPDDPQGPVRDDRALNNDSARLDAATRKANQLGSELSRLQGQSVERGR